MKNTIALLLCLCLLLCSGCGSTAVPGTSPTPALPEETAEPAAAPAPADQTPEPTETDDFSPDFTFSTDDRSGAAWSETVFAEHKLTMINFWEPWCGPCVSEMADLQALSEAYADQGLMILGVYSTPGMEDDVDAVLSKTGVQYPILHYCDEFAAFESGYVPTTIFVDQNGHVLSRELSADERSYFADVIKALGEERTSALYIGAMSYEGWAGIIEGLL